MSSKLNKLEDLIMSLYEEGVFGYGSVQKRINKIPGYQDVSYNSIRVFIIKHTGKELPPSRRGCSTGTIRNPRPGENPNEVNAYNGYLIRVLANTDNSSMRDHIARCRDAFAAGGEPYPDSWLEGTLAALAIVADGHSLADGAGAPKQR